MQGFMEDSEAAAAAAPASNASPSPPPYDPLARALQTLFLNVAAVVQGELQVVNSDYELLERMNVRVASEYENQGEFAQGIREYVENLKRKSAGFGECVHQIEEIDQEVTELEAVVSALDNYTRNLEANVKAACAQGRHFL